MRRKTLVALPIAGIVLAAALLIPRAIFADICPACFGLEKIAPQVYLDKDSPVSPEAVLRTIDIAREQAVRYFGTFDEHPRLLICTTEACDKRLGGNGAKAVAYGSVFIRVSPEGMNSVILAHEFSHIALHSRADPSKLPPAWFNEGLAVIVADDPRYLETCSGDVGLLPISPREWNRRAGEEHSTLYHQAACAVQGWLDTHGGKDGVLALLRGDLSREEAFGTMSNPDS